MTPLHSHRQYQERSFEGLKLDRLRIEDSSFLDCNFLHCSLAEAILDSCRFQRCTFIGCDLSLVEVTGTMLVTVRFEESKLVGVNWTRTVSSQPALGKPLSFMNSILNYGTFIGMKIEGLQVIECVAQNVDFRESDLTAASFAGSDLEGSLFLNTILEAADLRSARNYVIDPANNTLTGARFALPEAMSLLYALDIRLDEDDRES